MEMVGDEQYSNSRKFVKCDSFAPAYSALTGVCLWQIPFTASEAVQVVSKCFKPV
jgi:hypothetical protein